MLEKVRKIIQLFVLYRRSNNKKLMLKYKNIYDLYWYKI